MKTFRITSAWGALSVMLTLVALYLLLDRSRDAERLFSSGFNGLGGLFGILQGRDAKVSRR